MDRTPRQGRLPTVVDGLDVVLPTSKIKVGDRHRRDMGDIRGLADSILKVGLLQPIVIDGRNRLICGGRRLAAVKLLEWESIPCRVLDLESIAVGEFHENEMRKDFTPSERLSIAAAMQSEIGSRQGKRTDKAKDELRSPGREVAKGERTAAVAAKLAGFESESEFRRAKAVVEKGTPELIQAMDSGTIPITTAAKLAELPKQQQTAVLNAGKGAVKAATKPAPPEEPSDIADVWFKYFRGCTERITGAYEQYGTVAKMIRTSPWNRSRNAKSLRDYLESLAERLTQFVKEWPDE